MFYVARKESLLGGGEQKFRKRKRVPCFKGHVFEEKKGKATGERNS